MTRALLPLHLSLDGKSVVIVGGGPIARRKTRSVLETGADVTVIAPEVCAELAAFIESHGIRWEPHRYRSGDLAGAWLVFAATGDSQVDDLIESEAEAQRTFCVRVSARDRQERPTSQSAAVIRRPGVTISVGSNGKPDPGRAMAIRDAIGVALDSGLLPLRAHREP